MSTATGARGRARGRASEIRWIAGVEPVRGHAQLEVAAAGAADAGRGRRSRRASAVTSPTWLATLSMSRRGVGERQRGGRARPCALGRASELGSPLARLGGAACRRLQPPAALVASPAPAAVRRLRGAAAGVARPRTTPAPPPPSPSMSSVPLPASVAASTTGSRTAVTTAAGFHHAPSRSRGSPPRPVRKPGLDAAVHVGRPHERRLGPLVAQQQRELGQLGVLGGDVAARERGVDGLQLEGLRTGHRAPHEAWSGRGAAVCRRSSR